ncbi:hypothetical protein [Paraburkholderia sp. BR14374]|uniref:hypothetical protein n=1 Tax=Paraburkholderia sp. BR14374 TaxID=3237007 RepID=UPI0034CF2D4C
MEQNARNNYRCPVCGSNAALLPGASGGRELVCVSCPELIDLDESRANNVPGWFEPRPDYTDEARLKWFYESLDPETWLKPERILFAREAALWLCGCNPDSGHRNDGTSDPLAGVVDTSMMDHHAHLLEWFDRLERDKPTVRRTAAKWRDVARAAGLPYDDRIDGLLAAFATDRRQKKTSTSEPKRLTDIRTRSDALTPIIKKARLAAPDPNSATSVYEVLVRLAQTPDPPPPIIGYADGEIKCQADTETGFKFLSQKALKKRMDRMDARSNGNVAQESG